MTKTKEQKKADGTYTNHRDNKAPMIAELLTKIPSPMMKLNAKGKRFFEYVCNILISRGMLATDYIFDISTAAIYYSMLMDAIDGLNREGYLMEANSGYMNQHPYMNIFDKATKHLKQFTDRYGLSYAASAKLGTTDKTKSVGDLQGFLDEE